jgi:hypothetical protein
VSAAETFKSVAKGITFIPADITYKVPLTDEEYRALIFVAPPPSEWHWLYHQTVAELIRYGADPWIGSYLEITVAVEDMANEEPAILAAELRAHIDKCVATYTNRPVDTQGHSA